MICERIWLETLNLPLEAYDDRDILPRVLWRSVEPGVGAKFPALDFNKYHSSCSTREGKALM